MSRKLRVGVVGAGHLGTIHARLVRTIDDVQLVGIADPDAAARERIAAEIETDVCADHRQLIGRIDAAILAAPTDHHYWIGMELAEAGIHLLVEKPLALTVAEADALVRATRSRNLILQVGHVERFNPAFTAAAARLQRPRFIDAVRASGYTGRSTDVGVVLDLMIHDIDLVLSLVPSEVVEVEAVGTAVLGPHEDLAHARLRFANGCLANLSASRVSYEP
jgi:predicted dehydrogenase